MGSFASGLVLALGLCHSCSLDWTVGTGRGGSAGSGGSGGSGTDAAPADTGATTEAGDSGHEASTSCAMLGANVDTARAAARLCASTPTACKSKVIDQCGCTVFVAESSSAATTAYTTAIGALEASGCPRGCGSCAKPLASECLVGADLKDVCTP